MIKDSNDNGGGRLGCPLSAVPLLRKSTTAHREGRLESNRTGTPDLELCPAKYNPFSKKLHSDSLWKTTLQLLTTAQLLQGNQSLPSHTPTPSAASTLFMVELVEGTVRVQAERRPGHSIHASASCLGLVSTATALCACIGHGERLCVAQTPVPDPPGLDLGVFLL